MTEQENQASTKKGQGIVAKMQYVKDISFENPRPLNHLGQLKNDADIGVGVNVSAQPVQKNVFEVVLHIHIEAKNKEETAFIVDLSYAGVFEVNVDDPERMKPVLLIESPRLMFPYARQIISEVTANGGYMPLYLQPIDFSQLYEQHKDQIQETGQPPATSNAAVQ